MLLPVVTAGCADSYEVASSNEEPPSENASEATNASEPTTTDTVDDQGESVAEDTSPDSSHSPEPELDELPSATLSELKEEWQTDFALFRRNLANAVESATTESMARERAAQFKGKDVAWQITYRGIDREGESEFVDYDEPLPTPGTVLSATERFTGLAVTPLPASKEKWQSLQAGTRVTCRARITNIALSQGFGSGGGFAGWLPLALLDDAVPFAPQIDEPVVEEPDEPSDVALSEEEGTWETNMVLFRRRIANIVASETDRNVATKSLERFRGKEVTWQITYRSVSEQRGPGSRGRGPGSRGRGPGSGGPRGIECDETSVAQQTGAPYEQNTAIAIYPSPGSREKWQSLQAGTRVACRAKIERIQAMTMPGPPGQGTRWVVIVVVMGVPEVEQATAEENEWRTWLSADGEHSTEAKFLKFQNSKAHLERRDGTVVEISMTALSKADQDYIREELRRRR
ncbi:MAG: hypothetical protein HQ582_25580 [Planctomycetes bacterium]|nr:hypothetical protein [Planctomycetota bacterium]